MDRKKVLILGIDGMDPRLTKRYLDAVSYTHLDVYKRQLDTR